MLVIKNKTHKPTNTNKITGRSSKCPVSNHQEPNTMTWTFLAQNKVSSKTIILLQCTKLWLTENHTKIKCILFSCTVLYYRFYGVNCVWHMVCILYGLDVLLFLWPLKVHYVCCNAYTHQSEEGTRMSERPPRFFFWPTGRVITMTATGRNYELQKMSELFNHIFFYPSQYFEISWVNEIFFFFISSTFILPPLGTLLFGAAAPFHTTAAAPI